MPFTVKQAYTWHLEDFRQSRPTQIDAFICCLYELAWRHGVSEEYQEGREIWNHGVLDLEEP